jgi:hypothetical protein
MLKELQEKLKLEVDRMQNALVAIIKDALKEENVIARISEDLSSVIAVVKKDKEEDGRVYQTEYVFSLKIGEENRKNKLYSGTTNVLLLANNAVIGMYNTPAVVDIELINYIFSLIDAFRESELNPQPEAAPKEDIQPDNLF